MSVAIELGIIRTSPSDFLGRNVPTRILKCDICPLKNNCEFYQVNRACIYYLRPIPKNLYRIFKKYQIINTYYNGKIRKPKPPTWSQEVETAWRPSQDLKYWTDGSGPYEYTLPVFKLKHFIGIEFAELLSELGEIAIYQREREPDYIDDNGEEYYENGEAYSEELGCHFHVRVAGLRKPRLWVKYAKLLLELIIIYPDMLTFRRGYFRNSVDYWAKFPNQILDYERLDDYNLGRILRNYRGRYYDGITFNRNNKKTLTLEIRLNECAGLKPWALANMAWDMLNHYNIDEIGIEDLEYQYDRIISYHGFGNRDIITLKDGVDWHRDKLQKALLKAYRPKNELAYLTFKAVMNGAVLSRWRDVKNFLENTTLEAYIGGEN